MITRYVDLKACITRLPEDGYGANLPTWPGRLQHYPDRLQSIQMDAYISRKELFKAEYKYWKEIIDGYYRALRWKNFRLRNVLDMRAGFGGYHSYLACSFSTFIYCLVTHHLKWPIFEVNFMVFRFAAALTERKVDCWVLNVVPVSGPNTLPVLYDRGLVGVMHDW